MTLSGHKMENKRRVLVRDMNPYLTCALCEGYLIDATTLVDCHHVFCRSCILKYFENCKTGCPTCNTVYKKKTQTCFKSDPQIQSLVYKLVPGLYSKEMQRREDFYRSTAVRASSSCSDDSVLERERDIMQDQEERVSSYVGDKTQFFSPEDHISLSLEYYQLHLDTTSTKDTDTKTKIPHQPISQETTAPIHHTILSANDDDKTCANDCNKVNEGQVNVSGHQQGQQKSAECDKTDDIKDISDSALSAMESHKNNGSVSVCSGDDKNTSVVVKKEQGTTDKRYLQCPAAVSMKHLQKFIRMKYALTADHRVDIIYEGEVLPVYFSLMDVAYTFKWERTKPMRFFYRIFTPLKVRPIKIINTTSSTGGKQLQIVPVKPSSDQHKTDIYKPQEKFQKPLDKPEGKPRDEEKRDKEDKHKKSKEKDDHYEQQDKKEKLMAHLQLQSKSKVQIKEPVVNCVPEKTEKSPHRDCIYNYEEPDKEEIKRFAEKRDREWALQKKFDEECGSHHFSKKRKKNKHSKNESMHKKRRLHAEITSNEKEDLKLKVKITPHNGYKHKHHKGSQSQSGSSERSDSKELSSKEKLLQMRQIRHKHVSSEDKNVQTVPTISLTKINLGNPELVVVRKEEKIPKPILESKDKCVEAKIDVEHNRVVDDPKKSITISTSETSELKKSPQSEAAPTTSSSSCQTVPQVEEAGNSKSVPVASKTLRSDFATKQAANREWGAKVPTVQIERNEMTERQAQKTFLKTFQPYTEKYQKHNAEKVQQNKNEAQQKMTFKSTANSLLNKHNALEKKIANLQQHCTIESKPQTPIQKQPEKVEKKVPYNNDKPEIITTYPRGFTVSKIEAGVKRKAENEENAKDKRPSLEITLINPPTSSPTTQKPQDVKAAVKRPPPATIPLERIKKSNLKSGISIIPKLPERCDNIGALDLSKPNKSPEGSPQKCATEIRPVNGFNITAAMAGRQQNNSTPRPPTSTEKSNTVHEKMALSNLQMLSKVATEYPSLNKSQQNVANKPRPQMPNLQTLKIPNLQNTSGASKPPNLAKLPKLNEIKTFRFASPQIRNHRPNQNQNIRNIPNPSFVVRQQNQNRLNSLNTHQSSVGNTSEQQKSVQSSIGSSASTAAKEVTTEKISVGLDSRIGESKEISVG